MPKGSIIRLKAIVKHSNTINVRRYVRKNLKDICFSIDIPG